MTQNEQIVKYLSVPTRTLTEAQARSRFGVQNLRARISELRSDGTRIVTTTNSKGRAAYSLAPVAAKATRRSRG
jgi:hypothetical protein